MSSAVTFRRDDDSFRLPARSWKALLEITAFRGFTDLGDAFAMEPALYVEADVAQEFAAVLRAWRVGLPPIDPEYGNGEAGPLLEEEADLVAAWCDGGSFQFAITLSTRGATS